MQEPLNEKLSLLLDDQLDKTQSTALLKATLSDAELEAKWRRYALISQALKSEQASVASVDFVSSIHQRLDAEPTYFLPRKAEPQLIRKAGLAVAASLVLAVLWLSTAQLQKAASHRVDVDTIAQRSAESEQMNARFKEYLQAHDNIWYVDNNNGVQSYTRMASYQR